MKLKLMLKENEFIYFDALEKVILTFNTTVQTI